MAALRWIRHLGAALLLSATAYAPADEPVSESDFLVFVGQKIRVDEFQLPACDQCIVFDHAFRAHYRVVRTVYGSYQDAEIHFDALDHYGRPAFAAHEHALLFVRRGKDGKWQHEKYQYFPVYETQDGDWATCGSAYQFEHPSLRGPSTARPIAFKRPVVQRLPQRSRQVLDERFAPADWQRANGKATCRQGTPLAELFEVKKRGVLTARGLFK